MTRIAIALVIAASTVFTAGSPAFAEKKQTVVTNSRTKTSDKNQQAVMDFIKG